jgi:pyrroloquinoline-quinone synthase
MMTTSAISVHAATLNKIDEYVRANRYSRHSFVGTIVSGDYAADHLKAWAVQKYFQTREQNCVYAAVHYNARAYIDIRWYEVGQLVDEETNEGEGSGPHYELIRRLAEELGAGPEDLADEHMAREVKRFVEYLLRVARDEHPTIGMLASYINELQTPESAGKMYQALRDRHGFSDHVLEWFIVHAEADVEHASNARKLILQHADDVDDFAERAWRVVKDGIVEWRALHDFYYGIITGAGKPIPVSR